MRTRDEYEAMALLLGMQFSDSGDGLRYFVPLVDGKMQSGPGVVWIDADTLEPVHYRQRRVRALTHIEAHRTIASY